MVIMARKHRQSDSLYNERRRARRLVNSLEKQLQQTKGRAGRTALRKYINSVNKQIQCTYRGSGYNQQKALQQLQAQTAKVGKARNGVQRANVVFQQQIGLASNGKRSSLGQYGTAKVKIFYRATQRYWEGLPAAQRNQAIMARMGVSSLSEAFERIMSDNGEALDLARGRAGTIADTDESRAFQASVGEDITTSPDYLDAVVMR